MQRNGHDLVKRDYVLPDAKINKGQRNEKRKKEGNPEISTKDL